MIDRMAKPIASRLLIMLILLAAPFGVVLAQKTIRLVPGPHLNLAETTLDQPGALAAIAWSPWGDLIALEVPGQRILRLDDRLTLLETTGGFGFGDGSTRGASDLTIAGFEIWISDPPAGRIVRYDRWLAALTPFTTGEDGSSSFSLERPVSIAQAPSGDLALIEQDRQELVLLDPEGRLLERVAGFGESDRGLNEPSRVEFSPSGQIAVCDPGKRVLLLLDRFGSLLKEIPWPMEGAGPSSVAFHGTSIILAGDAGLVLLDKKGDELMRWGGETIALPITDLAIHGNKLVVASDQVMRLYTIESGR
ncbi:hypothetical protein KQI63_17035 [bacterium]|nr:hypothetical protein [bacterium]